MKKEKEKETRTSIVQVILDDYEHGDTDWRKYLIRGKMMGNVLSESFRRCMMKSEKQS